MGVLAANLDAPAEGSCPLRAEPCASPASPSGERRELRTLDPEIGRRVGRLLALALRRSGWGARPSMWPRVAVTFLPGRNPVVRLRADLAAELDAADLRELAAECRTVLVPLGHVLAWVVRDDDEAACACLVPLRVRP